MMENKHRIIQEFVPGKQVTLAHIIPSPVPSLYMKLGLIDAEGAIGIFTITPNEATMIAADVAGEGCRYRAGSGGSWFNGSLVITGDVAAVEAAMSEVMHVLCEQMGFTAAADFTRS